MEAITKYPKYLWVKYLKFLLWGLLQGAISYIVLLWIRIAEWGDFSLFLATILNGVLISGVVFAILLKAPRWLQSIGFIVISFLLPVAQYEESFLIYHGVISVPDGLAIIALAVWTIGLLPFSIMIGLIYFFVE